MDFLTVSSLPMAVIFLVIGLSLLLKGGDYLVDGAVGFAEKLGLPQAFVGLTIVAFGTSAPELFTSVMASLQGKADISVGNILGSNIFNICLVLGFVGTVSSFNVNKKNFIWDWLVLIASVLLLWFFARDLSLNSFEGALLFLFYIVFVSLNLMVINRSKKATVLEKESIEEEKPHNESSFTDLIWVALGLVLLSLGAKVALDGGVHLGIYFGISDRVIGLVILALGTSLPELVTSIMAAIKGHNDIAVSNIVGSNIMNILIALGVTAIISPLDISPSMINPDLYVVLFSSLLLGLLIAAFKFKFNRFQGIFWILFFVIYFYEFIYLQS